MQDFSGSVSQVLPIDNLKLKGLSQIYNQDLKKGMR